MKPKVCACPHSKTIIKKEKILLNYETSNIHHHKAQNSLGVKLCKAKQVLITLQCLRKRKLLTHTAHRISCSNMLATRVAVASRSSSRAGGAAHFCQMVAAKNGPCYRVPVKSRALSGVDSLYSIAQMLRCASRNHVYRKLERLTQPLPFVFFQRTSYCDSVSRFRRRTRENCRGVYK